jgi:hypothetical protein
MSAWLRDKRATCLPQARYGTSAKTCTVFVDSVFPLRKVSVTVSAAAMS